MVIVDNNVEKNVVLFVVNVGIFLSSQLDSDVICNFIIGMVIVKVNQEIQEWFGKYGIVCVKLNVDKDFLLKDFLLEMFYLIYDMLINMLFIQGVIYCIDDCIQLNIGFGWCYFLGNDWMVGVNIFIDYDLFCSYICIGVGVEYWCDYLKLSVNGYIWVFGWKKLLDVEDYQECLVNGWDICVEGYLFVWLQFGVSLMYEQYYGDEVGLFGKDKCQKDLYVIFVEVIYMLVFFLILSVGYKQGKSGENDICFGLEVNYWIILMVGVNFVGGSMWVDIEVLEGVMEKDY